MKQKLIKEETEFVLPITVEEEYQFNNQMFQISEVKDNYINIETEITSDIMPLVDNIDSETDEEDKLPTEEDQSTYYQLYTFVSENPLLSKTEFDIGDQIRVCFKETNELEHIKIKLNNNVFELRTIFNKNEFLLNSIPKDVFVILEYQKEEEITKTTVIVNVEDGEGEIIPEEEEKEVIETFYFFKVRYIENLNCDLLENNYNMYYRMIINTIKDFEKKFTRNILDCKCELYIDSLEDGNIILPLIDARNIEKITYLSIEEIKEPEPEPEPKLEPEPGTDIEIINNNEENNTQDNENIPNEGEDNETEEKKYKITEKELDSSFFNVYYVGEYNEQMIIENSSDFKLPDDDVKNFFTDNLIKSDEFKKMIFVEQEEGQEEIIIENVLDLVEMPYKIYFNVGYEKNKIPQDLKLAFMNDIQFKLMNRGSDILSSSDKTLNTTDLVKNIYKNYKYMKV